VPLAAIATGRGGSAWRYPGPVNELPETSHSQTEEIFMENAYEAAFGHRLN